MLLLLKVMLSRYALHRTGHGQELGQSQNLHSCYDQRPERVTVTKQHPSALFFTLIYEGAVFLSFHQSVPLLTQPSILPPSILQNSHLSSHARESPFHQSGREGRGGGDRQLTSLPITLLPSPPGHLHLSSWGKWLHFGK